MAIRLVADSTADLPAGLVDGWNITIVPAYVNFSRAGGGVETLRDGVEIDTDAFYKRLVESPTLPTTSQPSAQDFLEVYQDIIQKGDRVISVHISSKLSGTYNSATQAKAALKNPAAVEVVDSASASMGAGMTALAGARAIASGAGMDEALQEIREAAARMRIYFMVDTLEYLQKGGRIGKAQAFVGSLLSLKPILTIANGEISPLERVRTRRKALQRLSRIAEESGPISEACVIYNTTPQDLEPLRRSLGASLPPDSVITARVGAGVGVHTGPGVVGLVTRSAS